MDNGTNQNKQPNNARPGNTSALKHGAEGTLKRIQQKLPLAEDDRRLKQDIINRLGYDYAALPPGPLGLAIELTADNVLLAFRFQQAQNWAAEQEDLEAWLNLGQRRGWRNDKSIAQLLELAKLQEGDGKTIEAAIDAAREVTK